ncbi:hypothetical protein T492DRAFT_912848 [Pavlovales sp. CCMP2436]|nr:hypothetical protein T492DRAFT_912848 [Pavlovales sp. CCMP2436]
MAALARRVFSACWETVRHTTQNIDDSPFKVPWRSWLVAGTVVTVLYTIDIPDIARRKADDNERKRLDLLGMRNVHRELPDGRYLMRDGSICKTLE